MKKDIFKKHELVGEPITFRLTLDEKKNVTKCSKSVNLNVSEFVRTIALDYKVKAKSKFKQDRNSKDKRDKNVVFKVTEKQLKKLDELSEDKNVKLSTYVRIVVLDYVKRMSE